MTATVIPLPFKGDLIDYIKVHGREIAWLWRDGEAYIPAKPICDLLGLSWSRQRKVLTDAESGSVVALKATTGADGKTYQMLCVAYPDFMMWLAGITVSRVKEEAREAVRATRNEIKLLIANYYRQRIFGEMETRSDLLASLKMDALQRKPLRIRVLRAMELGWDFEKLYKSGSASRPKLVQTISDMLQLGLIQEAPAGTPFGKLKPENTTSNQIDMFGGAHA